MNESSERYIISILARDRVGILADVADTVFELGGNIFATSQTIMQGWFTMILSADFPLPVKAGDIEAALARKTDFTVTVKPDPGDAPAAISGEPFVITMIGDDRPGIVRGVARCCAAKGVNIVDVWNEVCGGSFVVILSVAVPHDLDPKDLRYELEHVAGELGVTLTFQHQDIFTATNSLDVHTKR